MSVMAQVTFEASPAGVRQARADLDRFEAAFQASEDKVKKAVKASPPAVAPAAAVLDGTGLQSRTRELLKVLPGGRKAAKMPEELAELMKPNAEGETLSRASVRAVLRNEKRIEHRLKAGRVIDREVVKVDFDGYDAEGAGRYYVGPEDRAELDKRL